MLDVLCAAPMTLVGSDPPDERSGSSCYCEVLGIDGAEARGKEIEAERSSEEVIMMYLEVRCIHARPFSISRVFSCLSLPFRRGGRPPPTCEVSCNGRHKTHVSYPLLLRHAGAQVECIEKVPDFVLPGVITYGGSIIGLTLGTPFF